MKVKFYMLPPAFWEGKWATLPFTMTNILHLKRSQYHTLVPACKIWLSSHIWATLLKSWTVAECMSAFMRVAAPIASEVEMALLLIRFDTHIMLLDTWMTNYLLKRIKDDSEDYLTFEHDNLFQSFISTIKDDLLTHKKIFTEIIFCLVYMSCIDRTRMQASTGPSKNKTTHWGSIYSGFGNILSISRKYFCDNHKKNPHYILI
jgi:hypothetical protein